MTDKEVEKDTDDAKVTCTVSGVTAEPTIVWKTDTVADVVVADSTNYQESTSQFKAGTNEHESVLNVKAAKTNTDQTYTCLVTSAEWDKSEDPHDVVLNVLGMYFTGVTFSSL